MPIHAFDAQIIQDIDRRSRELNTMHAAESDLTQNPASFISRIGSL